MHSRISEVTAANFLGVLGTDLGDDRAELGDDVGRAAAVDQADVGRGLIVDPAQTHLGHGHRRRGDRRSPLLGVHARVRRPPVKRRLQQLARRRAQYDLADRGGLVIDVAEPRPQRPGVEGTGTLQARLLLGGEDELDPGVRDRVAHDAADRLEHHRDRGLVVGAEDRRPAVDDAAVLDDRLDRPVGDDRVHVGAEEDRPARCGRLQTDVEVAHVRAGHRRGPVLLHSEAEVLDVGHDPLGDHPLLSRGTEDPSQFDEETGDGRGCHPCPGYEPAVQDTRNLTVGQFADLLW